MGPFGRVGIGFTAKKNGVKKDLAKEENKIKVKNGGEEKKVCKVTEDGHMSPLKKENGETRTLTRLFSWSKDGSLNKSGSEKECEQIGRRISAPGKFQSIPDLKADLGEEGFGLGLGLSRIKTHSGPLFTTSTRSGPVFGGTLHSRFDIGDVKKEKSVAQASSKGVFSSRSLAFWKAAKASKSHSRDTVPAKEESIIDNPSKSTGRNSSLYAEPREVVTSSRGDLEKGSSESPFVGELNLSHGSGNKRAESSLSESCITTEESACKTSSSGQVSQTQSAGSWVDVDSNFGSSSTGGCSMQGSPGRLPPARSLPVQIVSLQG